MFCKTTAYFSWSAGISGILLFSGTLFLIAAENADAPPRKASVFKLVHKHAHERTYAGEVSYAKTADISCKSYILQKNNRLNIIAVSKKPWHMNDKIKIKYQDLLGLSG